MSAKIVIPESRTSGAARFGAVSASETGIDFANILFGGPCNRACPFCIGKLMPARVNENNLNLFPPRNIGAFIGEVNRLGIRQIVFTGTTTDPQLYRHEAALLSLLREQVTTGAHYSVHTNGARALERMDVFNRYDRACISFPSFAPETYERMMGSRRVPDLKAIVERAGIPVKVSCVVDEQNAGQIDSFIQQCRQIRVKRLVLRHLYGETREWGPLEGATLKYYYRGNPVYDVGGMDVTCWSFDIASSTSINLFADGTIGTSYLLADTPELR